MALQKEFKAQGDFLFKNRSYLPLLILAIGLGVFLYGQYINAFNNENIPPSFYEYICLGISLLGLAIRVFTVGHTPKNTSGRNTSCGQVADELNTTGIYSLVRHPLYLGNFLMWLGVALLTENFWFTVAFVLLYWLYYERIMYAEENFLIGKFGKAYLEWASVTPAFFPCFKNYRHPNYPFSLKKVLKKEKNGLAAIFIIFWLFQWCEDAISEKSLLQLNKDFWFYSALISSVIYLILKIIKKRKLLEEINR